MIILTDQWRAQSLGYIGNPDVQTPNVDQLAEESANFQFAVSRLRELDASQTVPYEW